MPSQALIGNDQGMDINYAKSREDFVSIVTKHRENIQMQLSVASNSNVSDISGKGFIQTRQGDIESPLSKYNRKNKKVLGYR